MPKYVRSARGEQVDFELIAIKAQLKATPVPRPVEERKVAIDAKDGVRTDVQPDLDMLAVAQEAAAVSASQATGKQLSKK
jgi:hypothetical protein